MVCFSYGFSENHYNPGIADNMTRMAAAALLSESKDRAASRFACVGGEADFTVCGQSMDTDKRRKEEA